LVGAVVHGVVEAAHEQAQVPLLFVPFRVQDLREGAGLWNERLAEGDGSYFCPTADLIERVAPSEIP
jgi:hypothetical protein